MLQDVKGFRAPAINALNAATRRQKIIGGDVTPTESDEGTVLTINDYAAVHPFRLFSGIIYPEGAEGVGCALGKVFVAGESMAIVPGIDVLLSPDDATINPNPYAWCLKALPTYNGAIEWRLVRWHEAVYIIARIGETPVEECIKEGETIAAADVETLAIIGTLSSDAGGNSVSIEQVVTSDVYYGGGTSAKVLMPWQVAENGTDETGAQKWKVYAPQWVDDGKSYTFPESSALGDGWYSLSLPSSGYSELYAVLEDGELKAATTASGKYVKIGSWAYTDGVYVWTQAHTGTIFTSSGLPVGTVIPGGVYNDSDAKAIRQHMLCWDGEKWLEDVDTAGQVIGPTTVLSYALREVADTTLTLSSDKLMAAKKSVTNIMALDPSDTPTTYTTVFATAPLPVDQSTSYTEG